MKRWGPMMTVLLVGWLTACNGSESADQLSTWQQSLGEALDQPLGEPRQPGNIGEFPAPRELLLDTSDVREGMLDIYALRHCGITNLVAKRNNQLGRVAPPSQRWVYELTLWRRLDSCLNGDTADHLAEEDLHRLQRIATLKTRELPTASYNALVGSDEWTGSFARASAILPPDELASVDDQLPALNYLREAVEHQFDHTWQPDISMLEAHLNSLRSRPLSAELMRSLILASTRVEEGNVLLTRALEMTSGCPAQWPPTLPSPPAWLDDLTHQSTRWFTAMNELLDAHIAGTPALQKYRREWLSLDNRDAPLPRFIAAHEHYRQLLHTFHQRCI